MASRKDCAHFEWDDGYPICKRAGLCCDATENAERCEHFIRVGELTPPKVAMAGVDCPRCKEFRVNCDGCGRHVACYQFEPIEVNDTDADSDCTKRIE